MVKETFKRYSPRSEYNEKADYFYNTRGKVYTYPTECLMAATSADTEIINGYTSIFGTSAASSAVVDLVSSDGADDSRLGAGSQACTAVKIFGIDTAYNYVVEEVDMTGTSNAATTTTWHRLIGMWISNCGSGNSHSTGNITCHNTGSTSYTFMTLTSGYIGTSSMTVWIAPNWECHVERVTAAICDESVNILAGARFYLDYDDQQGVGWEATKKASCTPYGTFDSHTFFHSKFSPTVEPSRVAMFQQCNSSAHLTTVSYGVNYILYPKRESLSSTQYDYISEV